MNMDCIDKAIKQYLENNYVGTEDDMQEASESMTMYLVDHIIPDVAIQFELKETSKIPKA